MSEINILQEIDKLKKEEEQQLAEMRLKRFREMESKTREIQKRNEEEEINKLMKKESDLLKKRDEMKRKMFQLKVEASSWETVAKAKASELTELQKKLNECYGKIWSSREKFCDEVGTFLKQFDIFSKNKAFKSEQDLENENRIEEDIKKLQESIAIEENVEKILTKRLNDLQEEKRKVEESIASERKRLEDWIEITRDRCTELNRRINEKRTSTDTKSNSGNNQLFSIVNLEDVKKLTQV